MFPLLHRIAALFLPLLLVLTACGSPLSPASSDEAEDDAPISGAAGQTVATFYPDWDPDEIYIAGDIVVHDGIYFRALWWTQGNEPQTDVSRDEWQELRAAPTQDSPYFSDVSAQAWYAEAVNALAADGILGSQGASDNFRASRPATRAQFAQWLCRALEIAPIEGGDNFTDAGNTWYTPYLAALKQQGLSSGDDAGRFHPTDYITRQEACQLLYRACDGFAEDPLTTFGPYADADDVASWAIQPVSWCIERRLLPVSGSRLLPEASLSRGEAAQMLYNLLYGATPSL